MKVHVHGQVFDTQDTQITLEFEGPHEAVALRTDLGQVQQGSKLTYGPLEGMEQEEILNETRNT